MTEYTKKEPNGGQGLKLFKSEDPMTFIFWGVLLLGYSIIFIIRLLMKGEYDKWSYYFIAQYSIIILIGFYTLYKGLKKRHELSK